MCESNDTSKNKDEMRYPNPRHIGRYPDEHWFEKIHNMIRQEAIQAAFDNNKKA